MAMTRSWWSYVHRNREGEILHASRPVGNLRTTAGLDAQAAVMGSGTQPAACRYLALSSDTTAPAAGDTTLTGEYTTNGLARALGTYAHTAGTSTFTESNTFTCTAASQTVNKEAVFNAASGGTMWFESAEPTPPTLNNGDTLTQSCQVSI